MLFAVLSSLEVGQVAGSSQRVLRPLIKCWNCSGNSDNPINSSFSSQDG